MEYVMSLPKEYRKGLTQITEVIRKIDRTAIEGYRGKVQTEDIAGCLEAEQRMTNHKVAGVIQAMKDAKINSSEIISRLNGQEQIAEKYGLGDY